MSLVNILISDNSEVMDTVRSVYRDVEGAHLEVFGSLQQTELQWDRSDVVLGMVHVKSAKEASLAKEFIIRLKELQKSVPVIFLCDPVVQPTATLDLLRLGAVDCLRFPFEESKLKFLVESLTLRRRFEFKTKTLIESKRESSDLSIGGIGSQVAKYLYDAPATRKVIDKVNRIADRESTVLLTGETGSGKTRVARLIHDISSRCSEPFVHVDCASIPQSLIESELFGHKKGAFTSADRENKGKCVAAGKGTLFIDEIDAISLEGQARLLRLTDEHVFSPVGSTQDIPLQARVVVGTNRNLLEEVKAGRFRKDLYFRLNVFNIIMPPLRERKEEIRLLAEHFMAEAAERHKSPVPSVDAKVWRAFLGYSWPGNIRELKNIVEQIMAFYSGDSITLEDLPPSMVGGEAMEVEVGFDGGSVFDDEPEPTPTKVATKTPGVTDSWIGRRFPDLNSLGIGRASGEIKAIMAALVSCKNNRTQAAELLGISREALYKKLRKYDLMEFDGTA